MADWFFIGKDGKKAGPVTKERLTFLSQSGELAVYTLVWTEGLDDWIGLKDLSKTDDGSFKVKYSCPKCKSDNVQRVEILYNSGITNTATKTAAIGAGISGGSIGLGVGGATTKGTSLTQLAELLAPPKGNKPVAKIAPVPAVGAFIFGCAWFLFLLVIGMAANGGIGSFALILLLMAGGFGVIYIAFKGSQRKASDAEVYNKTVYPKELERWERSQFEWKLKFVCLRCGDVFIPS
ncbi:MAG: DUF4339 domain-containing protein [Nitrospinae bacterium]|nr:DUF4339 domain-containing protein [Nitrospinota bacterium]